MARWIRRVLLAIGGTALGLVLALAALYTILSRTNARLQSSGETRSYLLYAPANLPASTAAPLVISLHGAWWYPGMQQRLSGWNEVADRHGFLVAYPRATGFPRTWRMAPGAGLETEQRFIADLIDDVSARFAVDRSRIYVTGYSNGAAMTFMLSCTMADRIAAVGMVATPVVPWEWCSNARPLPMIAFHGTADPYAPYAGGTNFLTTEPLQSVEAWFATWGRRNACEAEATVTRPAAGVTMREFLHCSRGAATRLYTLAGAGHVWPGGRKLPEIGTGRYSAAVDATEEMWEMFQRHALQPIPREE